ncbi:hypothetical protein D9M69_596720 [compost metagenome]
MRRGGINPVHNRVKPNASGRDVVDGVHDINQGPAEAIDPPAENFIPICIVAFWSPVLIRAYPSFMAPPVLSRLISP